MSGPAGGMQLMVRTSFFPVICIILKYLKLVIELTHIYMFVCLFFIIDGVVRNFFFYHTWFVTSKLKAPKTPLSTVIQSELYAGIL